MTHERGTSSPLIHIGSAFPCLKVGLQAPQEVFPACARLLNAIASITHEEIMLTKEQLGPLRDRREIPGDRGPLPIMWGKPHSPMHFLSDFEVGNLHLEDPSILKANFGERAHHWLGSHMIRPPPSDPIWQGKSIKDVLWR